MQLDDSGRARPVARLVLEFTKQRQPNANQAVYRLQGAAAARRRQGRVSLTFRSMHCSAHSTDGLRNVWPTPVEGYFGCVFVFGYGS